MDFNFQPIAKAMLSDSKFVMGYSRWSEQHGRYETWEEAVERVMNMHREKYADKMTPELEEAIAFAEQAYKDKAVLGAQRALQFGGPQIFQHEARMYNCSFSYCDRAEFFQHAMYLLLAGCGVGFSVQKHHIAKLPQITAPSADVAKVYQIPDSIEGWADAFGVLLSSYFVDGGTFPEYQGKQVHFDYSQIRPRGALISGGFKAPGPDGLQRSIEKCRELLDGIAHPDLQLNLKPIHAYDFVMHMADAVLSGGIRRAATICIFSKDDQEMMTAKTGNWFDANPQRGRSNNSALLIRKDLTREEWAAIMKSVRQFGEPGFIFAEDTEQGFNPCVEIGLRAYTKDGRSGFQFCNLTEGNGAQITSLAALLRMCKASAILGTLQAGYTNFTYLGEATREITEREALLGCSITGWMTSPDVLFDKEHMKVGAELVLAVNKKIAKLIGINPAPRATTTKPSGNASVLLGTDSGIHGAHSARYFRNVQMTDQETVMPLFMEHNPKMVDKSVWDPTGKSLVVSFPIVASETAIFKKDLLGVKQLEYVKLAQRHWIEHGSDDSLSVDKRIRHNISNTISVGNTDAEWAEVEQYIFDNRQYFAGISLMAGQGDKAYAQAPFTEVLTAQEIMTKYGEGSMFASGLIVDGMKAFANNLWAACDTAQGFGMTFEDDNSEHLLPRDWVRRAKKFANNYFGGNIELMTFCLKDVYNLHKWENITRALKPIDFSDELKKQTYTEVDTMGAIACNGDTCEVVFK